MRLNALAEPEEWGPQFLKKALGFIPGPVAVMQYRPEFFGRHYARALQEGLRGGEAWRRGELELFAAFISSRNQCAYGTQTHGAVAALYLGKELVRQVLADYLTAPVAEPLRATLIFLEKLTLLPAEVGPEDVQRLRETGVSDQGIREALLVSFLTGIMNRLSAAFDFELPPPHLARPLALLTRFFGYERR
jgi:uncharacterized peroxidase-related enzyme